MTDMEIRKTDLDRFESFYTEDENGCWVWHGTFSHKNSRKSTPTPYISIKGKNRTATKWIWEALYGPVPKGHVLVADCGNTKCVNPTHRAVSSGKSIGRKRLPPKQGPKLPDPKDLPVASRLALSAYYYRLKLQLHGAKCEDCGGIASTGARRCKPCWDKKRKELYARNPEVMLRNRYRVWKARRDYVRGTKQGTKAAVRETS